MPSFNNHKLLSQIWQWLLERIPTEEHESLRDSLEALSLHLPLEELSNAIKISAEGKNISCHGLSALTYALGISRIVVEDFRLGISSVATILLYFPYIQGDLSEKSITGGAPQGTAILLRQFIATEKIFSEKGVEATNKEVRELLVSTAGDVRVILLMIAWRLYLLRNGRQLLSPFEAEELGSDVSKFFVPLTHKLGLYAVKGELEDLSLKFMQPAIFQYIKKKLGEKKAQRESYMQRIVRLLEDRFAQASFHWKYRIKFRTKSIYSVYNKMVCKKVAFDDIYDLSALRIIIDAPPQEERGACWYFYSLVTDIFEPIPNRLRDWITVPKANGYQSLQITLKTPEEKFVEVQIRTQRMDEVAEYGIAAHWRYKGLRGEEDIDRSLSHARSLLEETEDLNATTSDENRYNIGQSLYIYVFTPQGKPIKLPQNATVLDFAYAIHSNIGNHARSGMINGQNAPLRSTLKSGDTVEILTDKNQSPSKDWLQIIVSNSARNKIRRYLREKREGAFTEIREQIERRLRNRKIPFEEKTFIRSYMKLGYRSHNNFYSAVEERKCDIARFLEVYEKEEQVSAHTDTIVIQSSGYRHVEETADVKDKSVTVDEETDVYYELAKCCSPQYGDAIFAYPSRLGVRIHRYDCPNARDIFQNHRDRVLSAHWKSLGNTNRSNLYVEALDEPDVTARIISLCKNDSSLRLLSYNIKFSDQKLEAEFTFEGSFRDINALRNKLLATQGVLAVSKA